MVNTASVMRCFFMILLLLFVFFLFRERAARAKDRYEETGTWTGLGLMM